jgi:hypothetical protein
MLPLGPSLYSPLDSCDNSILNCNNSIYRYITYHSKYITPAQDHQRARLCVVHCVPTVPTAIKNSANRHTHQGRNPFGSRGTTSSGAFDISALRPATGLGLERRGTRASQGKATEEGEALVFRRTT